MAQGPSSPGAPRERSIIHVDMDAFFASVEVLDNPELKGKPVIVGGAPEERGVVAAASYEARRRGIHSATSAARARRLCPDGVFLKPRFRRYSEMSKRIFAVLRDFTPLVEEVSIDEAFLDVTGTEGIFGPAAEVGRRIKERIRAETGLTASVGVAPNRFLAKVGSDLRKPDGFVVITRGEAPGLLAGLPVGRLWGVGEVTEERLAAMGIVMVADLLAYPRALLEEALGSYAERLLELARGEDESTVTVDSAAKSTAAETTFASDIADESDLRLQLDMLSERVARELRKQAFRARTVTLKARYPDFRTVTRSVTLDEPTSSTRALRDAARTLLAGRLGRGGRPLRLLGVQASRLVPAGGAEGEGSLFHDEDAEREARLDAALDELRRRFGSDAVLPADRIGKPDDG